MNLKELLSTDASNLAKKQEKALNDFVVNRLQEIAHIIKSGDYQNVEKFTSFSPAGDGNGCDNNFINFDYGESKDGLDIIEVCQKLQELQNASKK